ncbi:MULTISPECIES: TetR/AcrR family transcriptional regulator [Rhizobium]|uniref:TetR/AcrR family transcriptional regulator n=1 Tax=Rhizobium rhododendri TaxID=2506430 RepID=A0ABY8INN5_9HYPH|nr:MULTISPECIES: TetR/AcrR family transcriptional regulator [Rhizobium]MBO9101039.1 TetR/AcrR family transcriptional regulator [Rhizobium sp. L58/93]MBO9136834.1 TetR/AcrR family transcriptional regulator [Rhizobium sp. B209b/85]MBO9171627.1 TetR/AcrR family transcriptional regulator [Rhizobium sp. L245/93]MBO9186628.1 TetR/AcrR family transcriptional regulator [Rhizobium sp. E27B/91]QXZ85995.1 TetR/AcrR family transcriptional regulator [Rhizobium sp. K1/93]
MKEPISDQILTAVGALFYREGIRAVGIDRIIEEAKVAKATLYRHFPSKDHLVAAYLEDRHHRVIRSLREVLDEAKTPRDQIRMIFEQLHQKADSPEFRGCAFALAVAEHGDSVRVTTVARMHKKTVKDIFRAVMANSDLGSEPAAAHLSLLYEGALATVAVERDPGVVLIARDCAIAVFDTALHSNRKAAKSIP